MRLDAFLAVAPDMPSRSACARLIEDGAVTINETAATSKSEKVLLGDRVRALVDVPEAVSGPLAPNPYIPLDIRFEDGHLIVLSSRLVSSVTPAPVTWTTRSPTRSSLTVDMPTLACSRARSAPASFTA